MNHDALIYLDNNASTALAAPVLAAMRACLEHDYGNPSSLHQVGAAAKQRLLAARRQVAALLGAAAAEIVFTSGATESNQSAVMGALALCNGKRHLVLSAVEHPSLLMLARHLQAGGAQITYLGVDRQGRLDLAELEAAIRPDTALVSLMWANNETGVLFPLAEAAAIVKRRGALLHTDAVQAAGKIALDVGQVPVDLLSLSGHKLHAAKGVGALYVRKGLALPPLLFGHQERGRRGGTENLAAIAGFGVAAELAQQALGDGAMARVAALRDYFEYSLLARLPQASVNGAGAARVAGTSNVRFGTLDAEIVLDRLDRAGVCAGSGSACTAGGTAPSHVALAMGRARDEALASLRFSLSRFNTREELDRVLHLLSAIVAPLLAGAQDGQFAFH